MGTQGAGRRRLPQRERLTAEDDALNQIAREAEARLAAKRAARAEAREIRMKELERQQKEIYQVQKKYYGLDAKWGDIEQWMEDSARHSRRPRRSTSASDEDERVSVGSRGSLRVSNRTPESAWPPPDLESGAPYARDRAPLPGRSRFQQQNGGFRFEFKTNGYEGDVYGSQSLSRRSGRNSSYNGDGRSSTVSSSREKLPSGLYSAAAAAAAASPSGSFRPSELSSHLSSSSRASSRGSSARASPVAEERPEKDFPEKGSRNLPGLSAASLASLGGTSSRRGSGDTSVSIDTEASIREIKELNELKDQIQDVEGKYMQGLKEMKDSLAEVEEKYKKAMVSNAQLDNEKTNYMYQVDTLKDTLLELEEQLAESRRQYEEKSKELEREKHAHRLLQFQFAEVQAALQQREDMLQEIRQLQQKQESYVREISDLQETIEWKDRKIGALERQKEFFDSVRSDRDDLREEVVTLRGQLKKHGITLNSEVTANGETANHLPDAQAAREGLGSLHATGDGTLGRATEVEVKNEIVDNVGESETLQKTEPEQPKEDPVEDGVDTEVSPPGDGAEDQSVSEDSAPSLAANAAEEDQVQSQVLASSSVHEHTEQAGSAEATSAPDAGTGASPQQSGYLRELNSDMRGPETEQDSYEASDAGDQHGASAEKQEPGKQDCGAQVGEVSPEPPQEPAPSKTPEVAQPSSHQGTVPAGPAGSGEQGGTGASRPPRSSDTVSRDDRCVADVPQELAPSAGPGLEAELSSPEAAGPSAGGREQSDEEEDEGKGIRLSSAAAHGAQEATSPSTASAQRQPAAPKEPCEGNRAQQAGEPDSSPRKTKNKKKKNKKKKSPAAAETLRDDQKELSFQSPDPGEGKEDAQAKLADENSGVDTETEAPGNPQQNRVAGGGESPDGPERPRVALEAQLNPGAGDADAEVGQVATHEEPQLPGDALASEGGVGTDGAEGGRTQETEDTSGRVPLGSQGPAQDVDATSPAEGAAHAGPGSDGPAPAGESGDSGSAGRDETRGGGEKDKGKEDCALS